jgi:GNAT superfamily N-acetyltransferase
MKMYHDGQYDWWRNMANGYSRVKYANLMDIELGILKQLLKLNRGSNGVIYYPIRDVIDHKNNINSIPKHKLIHYKKSIVAYITHDDKVVSWAFLLNQSKSYIRAMCELYQIKSANSSKELHLYTKKFYRNKGLATQLVKSIKRKYPKQTYFSASEYSTIFIRNRISIPIE